MQPNQSNPTSVLLEAPRALIYSAMVYLLAGLLLFIVIASLLVGPAALSLDTILAALTGHGDPVARDIIFQIRAPRVLLALLIGAMLGLGGAALQGLLRNPLADPSLIGASNTAALGAVIALYFGFARAFALALPLTAILGALLGLAALLPVARRADDPASLILGGVAVSALGGAGVSLALNLAPNPFAISEIAFWLMGSLSDRSFQHLFLATPFIAVAVMLISGQARALDALTLGEDTARSLGFELGRTRLLIVTGLALGVGSSVAVSGAIGFVGLIAPHLVRPFTDGRPSQILVPSALGGALLLSLADLLVRLIPTMTELRLGVVTALVGAPMFIFILIRNRQAGWGGL